MSATNRVRVQGPLLSVARRCAVKGLAGAYQWNGVGTMSDFREAGTLWRLERTSAHEECRGLGRYDTAPGILFSVCGVRRLWGENAGMCGLALRHNRSFWAQARPGSGISEKCLG